MKRSSLDSRRGLSTLGIVLVLTCLVAAAAAYLILVYKSPWERLLDRAESGDREAQLDAAEGWLEAPPEGSTIEEQHRQAFEWYRRAAGSGSPEAADALITDAVFAGFKVSDNERWSWFRRSGDAGRATSNLALARALIDGRLTPTTPDEARDRLAQAAEAGLSEAQCEWGLWCLREGDIRAAARWLNRAAEQDHAPAQTALGEAFEEGGWLKTDRDRALSWYRAAARNGDEAAARRLGLLRFAELPNFLDRINAVLRNEPGATTRFSREEQEALRDAVTCLEPLVAPDDLEGAYAYALCLLPMGKPDEAFVLLQRCALLGSRPAMEDLAKLYRVSSEVIALLPGTSTLLDESIPEAQLFTQLWRTLSEGGDPRQALETIAPFGVLEPERAVDAFTIDTLLEASATWQEHPPASLEEIDLNPFRRPALRAQYLASLPVPSETDWATLILDADRAYAFGHALLESSEAARTQAEGWGWIEVAARLGHGYANLEAWRHYDAFDDPDAARKAGLCRQNALLKRVPEAILLRLRETEEQQQKRAVDGQDLELLQSAIEQGSAEAEQYLLAGLRSGRLSTYSHEFTLARLDALAEEGVGPALFNRAERKLFFSSGSEGEVTEGLALLRAAADAGYANAQYRLGVLDIWPETAAKVWCDYLRRSIATGSHLGRSENRPKPVIPDLLGNQSNDDVSAESFAEGWEFLRRAGQQNHPNALYNEALLLFAGNGPIEPDLYGAGEAMRAAAEAGHREAVEHYPDLWTHEPPPEEDPDAPIRDIFTVLHLADVEGDPKSMYQLGGYFLREKRFKDANEALDWLEAAADEDYAPAFRMLATLYLSGDGVPKDQVKAFRWLRLLADTGDAEAQYYVGVAYSSGVGTVEDHEKSQQYLQMAADQDHREAALALEREVHRVAVTQPSAEMEEQDAFVYLSQSQSVMGDLFPFQPFTLDEGALHLVTDYRWGRPVYREGERTRKTARDAPVFLLAAADFAEGRADLSELLYFAPIIVDEGVFVFTGMSLQMRGKVTFDRDYDRVTILLLHRSGGEVHRYWHSLGGVTGGRTEKFRLPLEKMIFSHDEVGLYFFHEGREIPSNHRFQWPTRSAARDWEFTRKRETYIEEHPGETIAASHEGELLERRARNGSLKTTHLFTVHVNEFGFATGIDLPVGMGEEDLRDYTRRALSTFYLPALEEGEPVPATCEFRVVLF